MPLRTPRVDSYMWTTTAAVASGATQSVLLGDVILTRGSAAGGGPAALVMGQSEVVLISIRYSSQLVRRLFSLLAYIMRSRVYETVGVRPSVCLTSCAAGLLLWAPRAGDIDPQQHRALSSKYEQCRVYSDIGSWTPETC